MDETKTGAARWLGPLIFWLLAIIAALVLLAGIVLFFFSVSEWVDNDLSFPGLNGTFAALFGLFGIAGICAALILIGILLRFAKWSNAPRLSLAVAITATGLIALSLIMFSENLSTTMIYGDTLVIGSGLLGMLTVALPPFLHWRRWRIMSEEQGEE